MNDNINLEEQYKKRLKNNYKVAMQVIKDVFGEEYDVFYMPMMKLFPIKEVVN